MALMFNPYVHGMVHPGSVWPAEAVPSYAHLMTLLMERSVDVWEDADGRTQPKLTMEQRGEQCYAWARQYADAAPQLADDLRAAARVFAQALYRTQ